MLARVIIDSRKSNAHTHPRRQHSTCQYLPLGVYVDASRHSLQEETAHFLGCFCDHSHKYDQLKYDSYVNQNPKQHFPVILDIYVVGSFGTQSEAEV